MSARKPLARMDSPVATESTEKVATVDDATTETIITETVTPENGGKADVTMESEAKEPLQIKQEKLDFDETAESNSSVFSLNPEAKRITRNSPMLLASSPSKKKPSESQERDSSTEPPTHMSTDEAAKCKDKEKKEKQTTRSRKSTDTTQNKSATTSSPPTNRLTRKAAMKDWAANTRLTRARRVSAGIGAKSENPPKRKYNFKKNAADAPTTAVKRKRSVSPKAGTDQPEAKIIKTEDTSFDLDSITIKQEFLESSEEMTSDVASDITDMFPTEPTSRISLRARKTVMCYSPTTRPYRRDKDKLEAQSQSEGRRKTRSRMRPDEDSKDSMNSLNIEEMLLVKTEPEDTSAMPITIEVRPSTPKTDDVNNVTDTANLISDHLADENVMEATKTSDIETTENNAESEEADSTSISQLAFPEISESVGTQLTVDTTVTKEEVPSTSGIARSSEQSNSSDKSASLSPEMVSEGVSEASVKKFYKKPEFLENNLGIENDPKLGEIVQNATDRVEDIADRASVSNESIKEGELLLEEDEDDVQSIGTIKNDHEEDEDANSVSTGFISPLLVEEEEEEDDDQATLERDGVEENSAAEDTVSECEPMETESKEVKEDRNMFEDKENISEAEEISLEEHEMTLKEKETTPEKKEISSEEKETPSEEKKSIFEEKETSSEKKDAITQSEEHEKAPKRKVSLSKEKDATFEENKKTTKSKESVLKKEKPLTKEQQPSEKTDTKTKVEQTESKPVKVEVTKEESLLTVEFAGDDVNNKSTEVCEKAYESENPKKEVKLKSDEEKKKAEIKQDPVESMEVDVDGSKEGENKVEETKIITDQEENKENVELKTEIEEKMDSPSSELLEKTTIEKENATSDEHEEESPSESSKSASPCKTQVESSGEATSPSTSPQSSKSSSVPRTPENDERLRQKERHLKTLGLLTHKAADEAIMAKQKRRKFLHNLSNNSSSRKNAANTANAASNNGSVAGKDQNKSSQEYTGTLKTIIKINRQTSGGNGANEPPKKSKNGEGTSNKAGSSSGNGNRRQSLKMTFQKGRGRPSNTEKSGENQANTSSEDSYYTIQNEGEQVANSTIVVPPVAAKESSNIPATASHGRKSYNRSNTTDPTSNTEQQETVVATKKDEKKEEILIPEKASSFKFHPGRLCQDQCYYCSGRFGLYDTPCHVGQIKSLERQQKILSNEEKLTVDNCLCDACFRHVDRRANAPSYRKQISMQKTTPTTTNTPTDDPTEVEAPSTSKQSIANGTTAPLTHICSVPDCGLKYTHSLRRKNIRKSIKKTVLSFDMSAVGTYLYLCTKHYEAVEQNSGCVLCKRRLAKNNMYHITTDTEHLEKALADMGIPVIMGQYTAVCKLCRYFANLLIKVPEHGKVQKVEFVKNYRKRLLQFHNIHDKKDTSPEKDAETRNKEKQSSKKENPSTEKQKTNTLSDRTDKLDKPIEVPPSPTHSTGSSVEMISDGGLFSSDENSSKTSASTSGAVKAAAASKAASNQMVLDNDVMVDYDVPMISDSSSSDSSKSTSPSPMSIKKAKDEQSKLKAILQSVGTSLEDRNDISTALRSNPNISMRELFPGEEDLGLQFKAPFGGTSSQRTPEGWTRINTFLQYDEPTRRLWEDLQKPYGNQSSFLRHLILLEKYYRNGDLILSSNASSNATVYTQTVRNRLTSFDSRCSSPTSEKPNEGRARSLSVDKIQRQLSSNSVTIIARPKEQQKDADTVKPKNTPAVIASATPNSRSILKSNVVAPKGGATVEVVTLNSSGSSTSNSPHSPSRSESTTPSDGSVLTKQQKILAAANKLMSNKLEVSPTHRKPVSNTTPPELISLNRRPAVVPQPMKRPQMLPKPFKTPTANVVVLTETLTVQERLESKTWRPTLLPVTTTFHLNNQQGPLYQTADGRRLPGLVQVQSGGKPFLISIHDYNRMCILRREKLMRDQMLKGSKSKLKGPIFPAATCSSSGSSSNNNTKPQVTNSALMSFNKTMQAVSASENAAKKQRLSAGKPGTYAPIAPKPTLTSMATSSATSTCTSQTQSQPTVILPASNLQPMNLMSSTTASGLSIHPNYTGQHMPMLKPTSTSTSSTSTISGVPTNSWLWNNFPDSNQMLINGKSATSTVTNKGPQSSFNSMKQQSLLLDNSLMSKIPKSLTVIPQHKLMPAIPGSKTSGGNTSKDGI